MRLTASAGVSAWPTTWAPPACSTSVTSRAYISGASSTINTVRRAVSSPDRALSGFDWFISMAASIAGALAHHYRRGTCLPGQAQLICGVGRRAMRGRNPPTDSRPFYRQPALLQTAGPSTDSRRPSRRPVGVVHQAVLQGVADQFRLRVHAHLLHEARLVGAHRLHRQVESVGDVGHRLAGDQQAEHLILAVRQRLVRFAFGVRHGAEGELLRHFSADERTAARHLADGRDELRGSAFLGQIAGGPRFDGTDGVLALLVHAEDEDAGARLFALDLLDQLDAAAPGHRHVEQQHVELRVTDPLENALSILRLGDDIDIAGGAQKLLQAFAHDGVVVG